RLWPLHRFLECCPAREPVRLEPWLVFVLTALVLPESLLGSSASNLYLAATLQRFPFHTDAGHAGDTAWAIRNALRTTMAVTPDVFSRFVIHPNANQMDDARFQRLLKVVHSLADEALREALAGAGAGALPRPLLETVCGLDGEKTRLCEFQAQL